MTTRAGIHGWLFRRASLRHWRREPWQSLTLLLIFSLGIATHFSVRLANRAAVGSFEQFHGVIRAQSDLVVRSPAGGLPVTDLAAMRQALGALPAVLVPVVESTAAYAPNSAATGSDGPPDSLRLVGLDLVQASDLGRAGEGDLLENAWRGPDEEDGLGSLLGQATGAWLSADRAEAWALEPGDAFSLLIDDAVVDLRLRGVLPRRSAQGVAPEHLVLMDLPALQRLRSEPGRVDRVEIALPEGSRREAQVAETRRRLLTAGAERWAVTEAEDRAEGAEMTAAFRLNLTVLSLIALLVALYLIAQALDAAVVRRRGEIATLRSLGFTAAMIRRSWRLELLLLGVIGGLGGLLLGWALAQLTAGAVAQTVNALYFATHQPATVAPRLDDLLWALALGVGGSFLAGWLPLRDAASTPPAQVLAAGSFSPGFGVFQRPRLGVVLLTLGAIGWFLPPVSLAGGARFPLAGYFTAFAWLIGGTLLVGYLFGPVAWLFGQVDHRHPALRLARARLGLTSSRHRLAAAGLFVALAMAAAMSILVGSFSRTMEEWIMVRFQADIYASSAGMSSATTENLIREETWRAIAARPEVAALAPYRSLPMRLDGKTTFLGGTDFSLLGERQQLLWIEPPFSANVATDLPAAYANEAFAARFGYRRGAVLELPTPAGTPKVRLAGIFADYGNEQGELMVDRSLLAEWFGSEALTNLSLYLQPNVDPLAVAEALRREHPGLAVRDNASLREAIRRVFRQTFAVTEALKYIGVVVALVGLALAQTNLLRESGRELRTIRSLGADRHLIGSATALECLGVGLAGTLGGLLASLGLGALLVFVINRQSFGWTLRFAVPAEELAILAGATLALSALTGYLVGRSAARLKGGLR